MARTPKPAAPADETAPAAAAPPPAAAGTPAAPSPQAGAAGAPPAAAEPLPEASAPGTVWFDAGQTASGGDEPVSVHDGTAMRHAVLPGAGGSVEMHPALARALAGQGRGTMRTTAQPAAASAAAAPSTAAGAPGATPAPDAATAGRVGPAPGTTDTAPHLPAASRKRAATRAPRKPKGKG